MDFQQVASEYFFDKGNTALDQNKLTELHDVLKNVKPEDLRTMEEHRSFVNLLGKFRSNIVKITSLNGENFNSTLASLLAVGADGVYHNDLRFLFELIQNVDDCLYADPTDCELSIHFDFNFGTITLEYNELGFTPNNVFSITGIAEAAKNISPDRIEIGEKGIGFKSVFGIADKVLIQSGLFSFMLYENNFTVPCEAYENFNGVTGTRLTLFLKTNRSGHNLSDEELARDRAAICKKLYNKLVSEYCDKKALFNKNPILFLNKLTKIRLYLDRYDSLEFTVSKGLEKTILPDGLEREDDVVISSIMSSRERRIDKQKTSISCTRYTMPIVYNHDMCVSRYGATTAFTEKKMTLQIVMPNSEFISEVGNGSLYSFLPTQVKTSVPVSCHIPFKLDSSRENVDSQEKNAWFIHSRDEFVNMLHLIYADIAKHVKNQILYYIPRCKEHFFAIESGNDKQLSLKYDAYLGEEFLQKPILYTEENHFKSCNEVFSFLNNDEIKDPVYLYMLLNCKKELFIAPRKCSVGAYGVEILHDAYFELFSRAIQGKVKSKEALDVIDESETSYSSLFERLTDKKIPYEMLSEISHHHKLMKAINEYALNKLKENKAIDIEIQYSVTPSNIKHIISEDEPIDMLLLDEMVARYLENRKFLYITAPLDKGQRYLITKNVLVLSSVDTLNAFAQFCRDAGKNDSFSAIMTMRAASIRLNDADDSLSISEYMRLLREVRSSIKTAFGKKHYESYIKVIRELNSDPQRFVRELLQNADDCKYADGIIPSFRLFISGTTLTTEYNEVGFTKDNVRSITAIGESTKKQINSGQFEIGEKGIGFKTVFSVAENVSIHSNGFHFKLSANTPTIPEIINPIEDNSVGTKMVFKLRKNLKVGFSPEQVLSLCLCLRNLKDICINNTKIHIEDIENQRVVMIDNKNYSFDRYSHDFTFDDAQILAQRNDEGKNISEKQEILFYISEKNIPKFHYYLYCGLPTSIELGVPFVIDAPYELTASRDNVLQNKWNERIRNEMYIAYSNILPKIAKKIRIKVMQYIRFQASQYGSQINFSIFKNDDDGWLSNYDFLTLLRSSRFIPTYDQEHFAMPSETAYRYPSVIHTIISGKGLNTQKKRSIIEDFGNVYDSALKNLGCKLIPYVDIANLIVEYSHDFMGDEKYRSSLYKYLLETLELRDYNETLKKAKFIPVKGKQGAGAISFVSYNDSDIYVDDASTYSPTEYNLLCTSILSKNDLECILNVDIIIMDSRYRKSLYDEKLEGIITSTASDANKYKSLMNEFCNHLEQLQASVGVLLQYKDEVPLLMESGDYRCGNVFFSDSPSGYFYGQIIPSHIVSEEATELAKMLKCKDISSVMYDDLDITSDITADDIETLKSQKIKYGYHILEQCIFDGYVENELIKKYGLEGVKKTDYGDVFDEEDFPNEPVKNPVHLRSKIAADYKNARKIIKAEEIRIVDKIQLPNGKQQFVDSSEIRENTLKRYRPALNTDGCFCQMCRAIKSTEYIEVNNICSQPEYYWPQMRVALCLECSKKFKIMRQNREIMEQFYSNIKTSDIQSVEAISVTIGNADIRFTQTHLAEIQEILKSDKK